MGGLSCSCDLVLAYEALCSDSERYRSHANEATVCELPPYREYSESAINGNYYASSLVSSSNTPNPNGWQLTNLQWPSVWMQINVGRKYGAPLWVYGVATQPF